MARILYNGATFRPDEYGLEEDFERDVVEHADHVFGAESLYIDVKKRIGKDNIITIPDGYLIDFSFASQPRLYIIENELASHDPYRHIGQQLLRFAISYEMSGRRIKAFLLEEILDDEDDKEFVGERLSDAGYRNLDAFLDDLIFEQPVAAVVVIDEVTEDLENVLGELTMDTDIVEFQKFTNGEEVMHRFTPFQQDVREVTRDNGKGLDPEELDTIVVPAREEGFQDVFLGEDCWYKIRISSSMLDRIEWIAGYQTAPVSAITHVAPVQRIEKYQDTGKYILHFSEPATEIDPIPYPEGEKALVPRAPRYTTIDRIRSADSLRDVFD